MIGSTGHPRLPDTLTFQTFLKGDKETGKVGSRLKWAQMIDTLAYKKSKNGEKCEY